MSLPRMPLVCARQSDAWKEKLAKPPDIETGIPVVKKISAVPRVAKDRENGLKLTCRIFACEKCRSHQPKLGCFVEPGYP